MVGKAALLVIQGNHVVWAWFAHSPGGVAKTSGSVRSPSECAGAALRVDILVFVRGSVRCLHPRGAKIGGRTITKVDFSKWNCPVGDKETKLYDPPLKQEDPLDGGEKSGSLVRRRQKMMSR
ncbi:zinc finger protein OZF isoform X2 [Sciurus carolinensis]|uniref:zinc finger protein OZF isoform X2 n=1 Tax=Sciurus carolinensis TaxID=30640 RepID=UPI001FB40E6B|nr:zinc finger protein OZF isoform X2 [Sciurus carolinensis]